MSWRASLACSRAAAEALPDLDDSFPGDEPPVLVADEPDPAEPDRWLLHAYFEHPPGPGELAWLSALAGGGEPIVEHLGESDWLAMSQAGLEPIRAGRFFVHTPAHADRVPAGAMAFEIDAGLAFGTGHHATTAGCLAALDALERAGERFANIADIGTGTGLLAFAALRLWPGARVIATDIDGQAVAVAADNARINRIALGQRCGELLLAKAEGMDHPLLAARAPFDLIIANILAGPLIALARDFRESLAAGGQLILAGLLDSQAEAVAGACTALGMELVERGRGEWPVLRLTKRT